MGSAIESLSKLTQALINAPAIAVKYVIENEPDERQKEEMRQLALAWGIKLDEELPF